MTLEQKFLTANPETTREASVAFWLLENHRTKLNRPVGSPYINDFEAGATLDIPQSG